MGRTRSEAAGGVRPMRMDNPMQGYGSAGNAGTFEHPELEILAAYVDGRLSSAERARVAAHLASCEDCFEVFAETVRLTAEGEALAPLKGADSYPFPFRRMAPGWRWAAAVAAGLAVFAVGLTSYQAFVARPEISTARLVKPLAAEADLSRQTWPEDVMRGGDTPSNLASAYESFQAGVLDVGLELNLEQGNRKGAAETSRRMANVLNGILLMDEETSLFRDNTETLRSGTLPAETRERMRTALSTPLLDQVHVDFGRWAEAGRLSALAGQDGFFQDRRNRRFLKLLLDDPSRLAEPEEDEELEVTLAPAVHRLLEEIEASLAGGGNLDPAERDRIRQALDGIIRFYHPQSTAS